MSCPICGKDTDRRLRPFCSKRCADLDLSKWLNGSYAIPSETTEETVDRTENTQSDPDRWH